MPELKITVEVSDDEMSNFLARLSGQGNNKVTVNVPDGVEVAAPAPAAPEVPTTDETPTTDKNGVEWNEKYHASSKALNADGTWRRRRGLSDEETAEAEAYEKGGEPEAPAAPETPAAPAAPVAMPGLPGMPGTEAPAAPVAPEPITYEELKEIFQNAVTKDPSLATNFQTLYAEVGVTNPNDLTTNDELRAKLGEKLRAIVAG